MSSTTITMMLIVSLLLGFLGVVAFIWGLKNNQFDDEKKFTSGLLNDSEEDLNEAIKLEKRGEKK
jgi:cbb3-type cytochrome oxidase maturation protein